MNRTSGVFYGKKAGKSREGRENGEDKENYIENFKEKPKNKRQNNVEFKENFNIKINKLSKMSQNLSGLGTKFYSQIPAEGSHNYLNKSQNHLRRKVRIKQRTCKEFYGINSDKERSMHCARIKKLI